MIKSLQKLAYLAILFLLSFTNINAFAQPDSAGVLTWKGMMDSCNAYQQAQDYQAALKWALQAEVKAKEEFGEIDTNYVSTAATISIIYYYLGNLDSAINYGGYCLSISRKLFNGVHPYLANYISNLAYFYNNRGNYKDSELLLKEA